MRGHLFRLAKCPIFYLLRSTGLMPACMSLEKRLVPRPPSAASGQITVGGSCTRDEIK